MAREVTSVLPDDPIEQAATRCESQDRLPTRCRERRTVGIITSSDVTSALVYLVGANEPGSRMEISVPTGQDPGRRGWRLRDVWHKHRQRGDGADGEPREEGAIRERVVVFRVDTIDTTEAVGYLEEAGYSVLWPPRP